MRHLPRARSSGQPLRIGVRVHVLRDHADLCSQRILVAVVIIVTSAHGPPVSYCSTISSTATGPSCDITTSSFSSGSC